MNELQYLLIIVIFLGALFLATYSWLYFRKVYHAITDLHMEVPARTITLLHASKILASLTVVMSIIYLFLRL
jgi:hypothetical protein